MKLRSLYQFYREHLGYEPASRGKSIPFGRAICSTQDAIKHAWGLGSLESLGDWNGGAKRSLTRRFLGNFVTLAQQYSTQPTRDLVIVQNEVTVVSDKGMLTIPFFYFYAPRESSMILPTFGHLERMDREIEVLAGLCACFQTSKPIPKWLRTYAYWDLLDGREATRAVASVVPERRDALVRTSSRLLALPRVPVRAFSISGPESGFEAPEHRFPPIGGPGTFSS